MLRARSSEPADGGRHVLDSDERAVLRRSLGFVDDGSEDTFSELARRGHIEDRSGSAGPAIHVDASPSAAMDRIEGELAGLAATVGRLATQVEESTIPADLRQQLLEVVRTQAVVVERLKEVEKEICRVSRAGFEQMNARLDALETGAGGGRRLRLDVLRRQAGHD